MDNSSSVSVKVTSSSCGDAVERRIHSSTNSWPLRDYIQKTNKQLYKKKEEENWCELKLMVIWKTRILLTYSMLWKWLEMMENLLISSWWWVILLFHRETKTNQTKCALTVRKKCYQVWHKGQHLISYSSNLQEHKTETPAKHVCWCRTGLSAEISCVVGSPLVSNYLCVLTTSRWGELETHKITLSGEILVKRT